MLVVLEEEGGPGNYYSTTMASQIKSMQAVGITVLGYDPTWWAQRNITAVEQFMLTWHDWYGVNGTYLDQMPNWNYNGPNGTAYYAGQNGEYIPSYFATLTAYARSLGMTKVLANAGADVPTDFIGSVDTIGTFENSFLPSLDLSAGWTSIAGLNAWHTGYNKSNFMFFSYNVPSLNPQYVLTAAKYVGYLYITNETNETDPYSGLSPYLSQLMSILASTVPLSSQGGASPPPGAQPPAFAQGHDDGGGGSMAWGVVSQMNQGRFFLPTDLLHGAIVFISTIACTKEGERASFSGFFMALKLEKG
jgi:hypothetical protein